MGSTIENKFKSISYKTSSRDHFLWQNSKANHSSLMVDYNKVHLISTQAFRVHSTWNPPKSLSLGHDPSQNSIRTCKVVKIFKIS